MTEATDGKEGAEVDAVPGKRLTKRDTTLMQAKTLKFQLEEKFAFNKHWEGRHRGRDFEAQILRLQRIGRNAGTFLQDDPMVAVSQQCFDLADKMEHRQRMFERMRTQFATFIVDTLSTVDAKLLQEAPVEVLSQILVSSFQLLIDKISTQPAVLQAVCSGLCYKEVEGFRCAVMEGSFVRMC